jgi:hypothetical protein
MSNDTFMLVGEMGGDCPIHGNRGTVWGDVKRHACGCPVIKGEDRLTQSDVHATLANIEMVEEDLNEEEQA